MVLAVMATDTVPVKSQQEEETDPFVSGIQDSKHQLSLSIQFKVISSLTVGQ
jgi:hypothetical protein